MRLTTGQVVNGRYRIVRLLGQGGMGAVYRAWDLTLNRPVALKEMLPDPALHPHQLAELRQQFLREAQALANLSHPNLPRVTDFFEWNSKDYLVMDFVDGESLERLIQRQGPLPEYQVLSWGIQLLDALAMCHERNIVHRDIKPQNIIICPDGRAVLVDFGLVKLWDPRNPRTQRIIQGMGTQAYASPEHFRLSREHTQPRSDIYSLGATLYHALVGREPPSAVERFSSQQLLTLSQNPGVRVQPYTEKVVLQALSMSTSQRFANAYEMKTALQSGANYNLNRPPQFFPAASPTPTPEFMPDPPPITSHAVSRDTHWSWELGTALFMTIVGVLVIQSSIWGMGGRFDMYLAASIGGLIAGSIGWFMGDTIYQALTQPTETQISVMPATNRPTTKLVMSTRKLMQDLSTVQQIGLLAGLVIVALLAAWILGPLTFKIKIIWYYFPSYAIAAPLAYAATGRRLGRAAVAHVLVVTLGGSVLKASVGVGESFGDLLLSSLVGGVLMEGIAFISNKYVVK